MARGPYYIVSEATEDRFDEADSLDEAVRIARGLATESPSGDAVSIEYNGLVIHHFVQTAGGVVDEAPSHR